MAKNGATARAFVDDLTNRLRDPSMREHEELKAFRRSVDGKDTLAPWDLGYWGEKQRAALYEFEEEELRPYFSTDSVLRGVFELVGRLYGVMIEEIDLPKWNESVRSFRIKNESGEHVASYKLPKVIVRVPEIFRAPSGKADYRWARETAMASMEGA